MQDLLRLAAIGYVELCVGIGRLLRILGQERVENVPEIKTEFFQDLWLFIGDRLGGDSENCFGTDLPTLRAGNFERLFDRFRVYIL